MDLLFGSTWILPSAEEAAPTMESSQNPAEGAGPTLESSQKPSDGRDRFGVKPWPDEDNSPFELKKDLEESLLKIIEEEDDAMTESTLVPDEEMLSLFEEVPTGVKKDVPKEPEPEKENICPVVLEEKPVPLLQYLCSNLHCRMNEIQLYLMNVRMRRMIIQHLRKCELRSSHIRPPGTNFNVRCDDITCRPASVLHALNGYMNITVRQYYLIKHRVDLRHPYLPCIIAYGGRRHRSYYPMEMIQVVRGAPFKISQ